MQRRAFIKLSVATTLALSCQACSLDNRKGHKAFYFPELMMACADEKGLKMIGEAYIKKVPAENSEEAILSALYHDDRTGKLASLADEDKIYQQLATRIEADFRSNNTLILDGWILSATEARQCALFSLTS
jgi:hypothetical protein